MALGFRPRALRPAVLLAGQTPETLDPYDSVMEFRISPAGD
jgi:hypothetical protein